MATEVVLVSQGQIYRELMPAIDKAFKHDEYILIESLLIGTEVTCGVHNLNGTIETFPITKLLENDFFDFKLNTRVNQKKSLQHELVTTW